MSLVYTLFLSILILWIIFLQCRRITSIILSWLLFGVIKKLFPHEDLGITVDEFEYFCVKGVHVSFKKKPLFKISRVLLEFVWDGSLFALKLQSTLSDLTLEKCQDENQRSVNEVNCKNKVELKGSVTLGIDLFSLHHSAELLSIVPESERVHGSEVNDLTSVWLFARNGEACIQQTNDTSDSNDVFCKMSVSGADAVVLYNSQMARLIILVANGYVTCSSPTNDNDDALTSRIATSDGVILTYKFVNDELISSHSRLKHTDVKLTPLVVSTLEILLHDFVKENSQDKRNNEDHSPEIPTGDIVNSTEDNTAECEVAFEAESVTTEILLSQNSRRFQLKLAVLGLGSPVEQLTNWHISVPFELMFLNNEHTEIREHVLGSKIKSDGLVNPCVLKAEGKESPDHTTKWKISFHQGILVQIKPHYVNLIESFYKAYLVFSTRSKLDAESTEDSPQLSSEDVVLNNGSVDQNLAEKREEVATNSKRDIFEISASISEIIIDVFDILEHNLLQVIMLSPQFFMSQDLSRRRLDFSIGNLKGFNCLENMPFFHPTNENEEEDEVGNEKENTPSLSLSVEEDLTNDQNKVSFKNFTFGSCDTTVIIEETLIFAVLKDFGLHKKVAQIFFQSRDEGRSMEKPNTSTQRFSFDYLELRSVEVILTLLPAFDLPVDLQVIKNNLGIPHQLPPRFENAILCFDAFLRNNIQYSSYKFISNDIKKHYLKELGSQSARVLGSMHLLGNISRLKQDIMSGFTTLRETGEFITFFRQVTSGVASSYSKFAGSWSDLFGMSSTGRSFQELPTLPERRRSDPGDLDLTFLKHVDGAECSSDGYERTPLRRTKDDSELSNNLDDSGGGIWLKAGQTDNMDWDTESGGSSDGEGGLVSLDLIPRNVKKQLKGQEFLRRLKENIADNEHGEVFSCCLKVRKNVETKLNALLTNRKVYFLKGQPSCESLVLCVKYESLYKAQYIFQDKTHYLQLVKKMKGIKVLSIPSRNASESPLVRCDNMVIVRKVASKINELKTAFDHECMHTQYQ